ncbi:hypothetical protein Q3G72_025465 [Acer saccharum]|nr:hypothetical protein Q3G72_025465 [Acer saccharum]
MELCREFIHAARLAIFHESEVAVNFREFLSFAPLVLSRGYFSRKREKGEDSCRSPSLLLGVAALAVVSNFFAVAAERERKRNSCSSPIFFSIVDSDLQEPAVDNSDFDIQPRKQKLGVVVKPNKKPRVVLKFIWMQNDIGIALDQMIPGHGTIPLSPYYFWPRKDAWEELKVLLESKPWISQIERIHLLNQATDIINLWQTAGGNLL